MQSILLVSQTLSHRVGSRSMVLNGVLARLGQFDDLRSFSSQTSHIQVGWECRPRNEMPLIGLVTSPGPGGSIRPRSGVIFRPLHVNEIRSVSCEVLFDAEPAPAKRQTELTQLHPNLLKCSMGAETTDEDGSPIHSQLTISRTLDWNLKETLYASFLESQDPEKSLLRDSLQFNVELDQLSLAEIREQFPTATVEGCGLRHFFPDQLTIGIEAIQERARFVASFLQTGNMRVLRYSQFPELELVIPPEIVEMLRRKLVPEFLPSLPNIISTEGLTVRDWIETLRPLSPVKRYNVQQEIQKMPLQELIVDAALHTDEKEPALRAVGVPDALRDSAAYLDHFFTTSINYLGPLRDEPKPVYPLPTSPDLTYVGLKGEFTAAVLDLHKYRYIDYIPSDCFKEPPLNARLVSASLNAAVSDWLQYLGVAESVHTQDRGKLGHELQVKTPGVVRVHDLTHAGVGVSQVLPILVLCLLGRYDSTLLIEQPELHLHPSVQSRLGDFFLSMSLLGKQCMIETHSEYLINRLRFRIACASPETPLGQLTKIYFVEKHNDASTFSEITVNEYGAIQRWPQGFFDESQNEAEQIIKAASRKRQAATDRPKNDKCDD